MARRLANAGYYVLLPNLFYRVGTEGNYPFDLERIRTDRDEFQKMQNAMHGLTIARALQDTRAMLDHVREAPDAIGDPVAALGYCMSGQHVVAAMAEYPDAFACGASFYGVGILTGATDSPHLRAERIRGDLYLAFAEIDRWVPPELLEEIRETFAATDVLHRIELYPGTGHGFAFPQRHTYDKASSERHWERIFSLFRKHFPEV